MKKLILLFICSFSLITFSIAQSAQWEHFYRRQTEIIFNEDSNFLWYAENPYYLIRFNKNSHQFTEFKIPISPIVGGFGRSLEDNFGNIWIPTSQGYFKFDGANFLSSTSLLGGLNFCDSLNNLWVSYNSQIKIFDGVNLTDTLTCPYGNLWWGFRRDNTGNIWSSVEDTGIVRYDGTSWTSWDTSQTHSKYSKYRFAAPDLQGNIYAIPAVDGDSGYAVFDGVQWTHIDSLPGLKFHTSTTILSLAFDNNNNPIFGTTKGISRNVNGIYQTDTFNIPYNAFWTLNYEPDGTIWTASGEYILHLFEGNWQIYKNPNAVLAGDNFTSIIENDSGKILIGGNGFYDGGISRYANSNWEYFAYDNSALFHDGINCMTKDTGGIIWAGSEHSFFGLIKFAGDTFQFTNNFLFTGNKVSAIAIDTNHNKVMGVYNEGIAVYNDSIFDYSLTNGLTDDDVNDVAIDSLNAYWIATEDGINIWNGVNWNYLNSGNSLLPSDTVNKITITNNGIKWIATKNGAARYDGLNWIIYNTGNSLLPSNKVNKIYIDKYDVIWFCTGEGLVSFNGNNWKIYNSVNYPLMGDNVKDVLLDHQDNLWIVTDIGVNKVSHFYASPYNSIEGSVFYDANQNGIRDSIESLLNNQMIQIFPSNNISFSSTNGNFKFYLDTGNYTIQYLPNANWILTSDSASYSVNVDSTNLCCYEFGTAPTLFNDNLEIHLTGASPHCGFTIPYWINYKNTGTTILDGTVWFLPDNALTITSSNPPVSFTSGDTLFWNFSNLMPFEGSIITLSVEMPFSSPPFCSYTAIHLSSGVQMDDDSLCQSIGCSFDPNDKSVRPPGVMSNHLTLKTDTLEYTINFQNLGNDLAFTVVIVDTISSFFDLNSFEVIGFSHPVNYSITPTGIVTFRFENINLPYAAFNEPGSHGFIKYRIHAIASVPDPTVVNNTAFIYFDFNPPIQTNTTFNTLVSAISQSINQIQSFSSSVHLFPSPASQIINIESTTMPDDKYHLFVYDLYGREILSEYLFSFHSMLSTKIDISNFSNGVYFIQLYSDEKIYRTRFVKQ